MNIRTANGDGLILHTLPGFMGEPTDWNAVLAGMVEVERYDHDLYNPSLVQPSSGLWAWAEAFNTYIKTLEHNRKRRKILLGYSLGGRLALHSLCLDPKQWDGAIIVSANPGLSNIESKKKRLEDDIEWSKRLLNEPWDSFLRAWNSRSVFMGDNLCFLRNEGVSDKKALADTLNYWSLGRQDNLTMPLEQLYLPILWVAGGNDAAYAQVAQNIKLRHHLSRVWVAPEAGHRVPWNDYEGFLGQCRAFINDVVQAQ